MKERPILFSAPMVRAILEGSKTQTRRVVTPAPLDMVRFIGADNKPTWEYGWCSHERVISKHVMCPYGKPGDRLWVRETWWHHKSAEIEQAGFVGGTICNLYGVGSRFNANSDFSPEKYSIWRKRPSIHMPRWASRITLEITDVRVERVQDISEEDAIAEGIHPYEAPPSEHCGDPRHNFGNLWDSINAKRGFGWAVNPWTWAISFRRIEALERAA